MTVRPSRWRVTEHRPEVAWMFVQATSAWVYVVPTGTGTTPIYRGSCRRSAAWRAAMYPKTIAGPMVAPAPA